MTANEVNEVEDKLRDIEAMVEEQGRLICSDPDSADDWHYCNEYVEKIAELIHGAYRFRFM